VLIKILQLQLQQLTPDDSVLGSLPEAGIAPPFPLGIEVFQAGLFVG
jgi:hypothetical protein